MAGFEGLFPDHLPAKSKATRELFVHDGGCPRFPPVVIPECTPGEQRNPERSEVIATDQMVIRDHAFERAVSVGHSDQLGRTAYRGPQWRARYRGGGLHSRDCLDPFQILLERHASLRI